LPKKYPPLTFSEVLDILKSNGFVLRNIEGNHHQYTGIIQGQKRIVTVDKSELPFDAFLIKSMILQSGLSRVQFYCSTKGTEKKISFK
jgi:predicted RNA binding protein YcfA (HicA-like mRNA interferase family)